MEDVSRPGPNAGEGVIGRVLDFWFGAPAPYGVLPRRRAWFEPDPAFDAACADTLGDDAARALAGDLDHLAGSPAGCLALIVLLDQVPRNLHRGTAAAYAGDDRARAVAERALADGFDRSLQPVQRMFLYMPFEHSESLADQQRSVALFSELGDAEWLDYARRHRDIIARFGRFPHRNAALGRPSTAEEQEFLKQPGSGF